jgi:hypothetical protein
VWIYELVLLFWLPGQIEPFPVYSSFDHLFPSDSITNLTQYFEEIDRSQSHGPGLCSACSINWLSAILFSTMTPLGTLCCRCLLLQTSILHELLSFPVHLPTVYNSSSSNSIYPQLNSFIVFSSNPFLPSIFTFLSINTTIHSVFPTSVLKDFLEQRQQTEMPVGVTRYHIYFLGNIEYSS